MLALINTLASRTSYILAMGIGGALMFVWIQVLNQPGDVATYVGQRTVEIGSYPEHLGSPIGWTTHIAISLSYATLCGLVASMPFFPKDPLRGTGTAVGLGLILGYATTVVAYPAIVVTTSLLAGQGFPADPFEIGVNFGFGAATDTLALINHLVFFVIGLIVIGVLPNVFNDRSGTGAGESK